MIEPKDPPADPRQNATCALVGIGVLVALFLGLVLGPCAKAEPAEFEADCEALDSSMAVEQTAYLWQSRNPRTFSEAGARAVVEEHFRAGMRGYLWWSRVYFDSGADWNPRMVSGDSIGGEHARGLCDILFSTFRESREAREACAEWTWSSDLCHAVRPSVRLHLIESKPKWYASGGDGWETLRRVFLPAGPHSRRCDREYRRWAGIGAEHERLLAHWWAKREGRR